MNKEEFLKRLKEALAGLPQVEINDRLSFYSEMIDDRMEEGKSEAEAVAELGSLEKIVSQILSETPITKIVKEKIKPKRRLTAWEIALLILGFPLWFSLLVAAGAVILALYIVLWSLVIVLWALEVCFGASAIAGIAGCVVEAVRGNWVLAIASLGVGLFFAGVSIFLCFGCVAATKGMAKLTKKIALGIKSRLVGKEKAK